MVEHRDRAIWVGVAVIGSLVFLTFARPWTWAVNAMATIAMAFFSALLWRTTRENSRLQEAFISMQLYLDAGDEISKLEEKMAHLRSAIAHFQRAVDALTALAEPAEGDEATRLGLRNGLLAARHPVAEVELAQASAEGGGPEAYRAFSRNLDRLLVGLDPVGKDPRVIQEVSALAGETLPAARTLLESLRRSIDEHGDSFRFQASRADRASLHIQEVLHLPAAPGQPRENGSSGITDGTGPGGTPATRRGGR